MTAQPRRRAARWEISVGGEEIVLYKAQWAVMVLLGPVWAFLRAGVTRGGRIATWRALERRGWAEFRRGEGWVAARLTKEGLRIRDLIHIREAERTNAALYDGDGNRRRTPRARMAAIPTTRS